MKSSIPQITYITKLSKSNSIRLIKTISEYLHLSSSPKLLITFNGEFLLWNSDDLGRIVSGNIETYQLEVEGGNLTLPDEVVSKLQLKASDNIALIERKIALSLKKVEYDLKQSPDAYSQVIDNETSMSLIREIQFIPPIDKTIKTLSKKYEKVNFKYNFRDFISNTNSFACWHAREILGIDEEADGQVRSDLIEEIIKSQQLDGSWGNLPMTARMLRELADLNASSDTPEIIKGIKWLLDRPESDYNPGMFFLEDSMIQDQLEIIKKRKESGKRPRFRQRKKRYENLISEGDGISLGGCGPQIMWPNALVLEALLKWGYEEHPRIQKIYETLAKSIHWCDCGYQHGISEWKFQGQITNFEKIERDAKIQALNAGLLNPNHVLRWHQSLPKYKEQKRLERIDKNRYLVQPLRIIESCGAITARALNFSSQETVKSLAKAVLWHCVTMQDFMGHFEDIDHGRLGKFSTLSVIAEWDHPAAKLIILRSIPWLLSCQNPDGSWGTEGKEEYTTLVVIKALKNVKMI